MVGSRRMGGGRDVRPRVRARGGVRYVSTARLSKPVSSKREEQRGHGLKRQPLTQPRGTMDQDKENIIKDDRKGGGTEEQYTNNEKKKTFPPQNKHKRKKHNKYTQTQATTHGRTHRQQTNKQT